MIRQSHFIAVVGAFLIGCAVLLLVGGCAGVRSQARKEEQGHAEAKASEEARCSQTRTYKEKWRGVWTGDVWTTNDVPGCPNGGLLSGADGRNHLDGLKGEDEIHGLGGGDALLGGSGNDVMYGGAGSDGMYGDEGDDVLYGGDGDDNNWEIAGGKGEDVLYGGKGNDALFGFDPRPPMRDELYCGPGKDEYVADRLDYVDSSCEKKVEGFGPGGGA